MKVSIEKAAKFLSKTDPVLRSVIQLFGNCTLKPHRRYFETLVDSIISQQISVRAAATTFERLKIKLNGELAPERMMKLTAAQFRSAGVSPQKINYLRDLSRKWTDGEIDHARFPRMTDQEVVDALVMVKGIGRWTAEMFLIFSLCRLDVLPVADLGFQRAVKLAYGIKKMPTENQLKKLGETWRPYRSIATWYLWRSLNNGQMKG